MTNRLASAAAATLLMALAAALAVAVPTARAGYLAPEVADGPSPDIAGLGGLDLAHDGTGSLVYTKRDGDGAHVFASLLDKGSPRAPVRVDVGQVGDSSSAQIGAAEGDAVVVTWINGGTLYGSTRLGPTAPWSPPVAIYGPTSGGLPPANPSLDASLLGTAYVAFTVGGDVRVARMPYSTPNVWTVLPQPLDIDPSALAADPDLATSADGSAIVAWTETAPGGGSHVWERRVNDDGSLSANPREASLPSLDGRPGGNADSPSITIQDSSSWAFVTFRQDFLNAGATQSRAIGRRLVGSQFEPPQQVDGQRWGSPDGAARSDISISGRGWGTWATALRSGGVVGGGLERVGDIGVHWFAPLGMNGPGNAGPAPITAAMSEGESGVVAWQQTAPGAAPVIESRHWIDNQFEAPVTLSPDFGPSAAELGFDSAADGRTDFVLGFVQGDAANRRIVTVTFDGPLRPAAFHEIRDWSRNRRPRIHWRALPDVVWGPILYRVVVDGVPVAVTPHTSWRARKPLPDGAHSIEIQQIDGRGQISPGRPGTRRIDTHGPHVVLKRGKGGFRLSADDGGAINGSGVATLRVVLGGRSVSIRVPTIGIVQNAVVRGRPARIIATDKVGNRTSVSAGAALRPGGAR